MKKINLLLPVFFISVLFSCKKESLDKVETGNINIKVYVQDSVTKGMVNTDASLLVSKDSLIIAEKVIGPANDTMVIPQLDGKYVLMISKKGFMPWIDTLTREELLQYSQKPLSVTLKKVQMITITLPKVFVLFPTVDISISGTGTFMIFRGDSPVPDEVYHINNNSFQTKLACNQDPTVKIVGDIDQISEFQTSSPLPGRLGILSIDLSMAVHLKKLALPYSFLNRLDLSKNGELEFLSLDATGRNECQLTSLDLSMNSELNQFSFQNVKLDHIQLKSVNQNFVNKFYSDLLQNVTTFPRVGTITGSCPDGTGVTAKEQLTKNYGWTVQCQ